MMGVLEEGSRDSVELVGHKLYRQEQGCVLGGSYLPIMFYLLAQ